MDFSLYGTVNVFHIYTVGPVDFDRFTFFFSISFYVGAD